MRNFITQHARALKSGLREIFRQPINGVLNLLVIGVALALPLGLYLLLANVQLVAGKLPAEPEISVFLRVDAQGQDIGRVRATIDKLPAIKTVRFISKQQALDDMQKQSGQLDILAGLDGNPLPDAFVLTLKERNETLTRQLSAELLALPAVEQVQHDAVWQQRLTEWLGFGEKIVWLLTALLGLALAVATGNTIRLQILTRRDEIEVARLFGATATFIRRPFLYHAWLQGLLGGGIAIGIVQLARWWINPHVEALAKSYASQFSLRGPNLIEAGIVLGVALVICAVGAWAAVSRHLAKV